MIAAIRQMKPRSAMEQAMAITEIMVLLDMLSAIGVISTGFSVDPICVEIVLVVLVDITIS